MLQGHFEVVPTGGRDPWRDRNPWSGRITPCRASCKPCTGMQTLHRPGARGRARFAHLESLLWSRPPAPWLALPLLCRLPVPRRKARLERRAGCERERHLQRGKDKDGT
ncbi:hypothetical protein D7V88_01730 [Corallococcus terminator]|uniref:Uncharacterized protein n=1 Tax=Corallococcus terminator TaxID=2316733 RepID=A0A3A8JFE4_9BACT|nr:hypothetical protein D7V88_01730 [Corallococcus terminator]